MSEKPDIKHTLTFIKLLHAFHSVERVLGILGRLNLSLEYAYFNCTF